MRPAYLTLLLLAYYLRLQKEGPTSELERDFHRDFSSVGKDDYVHAERALLDADSITVLEVRELCHLYYESLKPEIQGECCDETSCSIASPKA